MADPLSSQILSRRRSLPSNVEDFRWHLDTIENELRRLPQNLCVLLTHTPLTEYGARYSLFECGDKQRLGTHWRFEGDFVEWGHLPNFDQATDRFPFGVVLSRTASLLDLAMDAERPWLNFGGKCGFYVSDATVRGSAPEGEVSRELAERIIWHYFDENTGPIPKTSLFESVYEQLSRCYRDILEACMCVDDLISLSGDELTPVISELKEWPEVLLYLGLKNSHPPLRVVLDSVPRMLKRDFVGSSVLDHPEIPFDDPEEEWQKKFSRYHEVFRICPSSVASATSYALEALRRMVHAVDGTAADGEATPEAPRVLSRWEKFHNDEVKRAAKEDFHPSVDFLEPLFREIESIIDSFGIHGPLRSLDSLHMLFEGLMPTDFRLPSDGEGNLVVKSTDARSPAWERARHWLLAARLTELCDDFTDRTERKRDAIERLWRAGRQLDADDLSDLQIEEYVDGLQSLSRQLRQHTPANDPAGSGGSSTQSDETADDDKTQPDHGGCTDLQDGEFITKNHPDAEKYCDNGGWCTGKYAEERYGLKRNQLTKAHQNGLFGLKIDPPKKVKPDKGRPLGVFLRADLMSLADARDRQAEDREQSE